MSKPRVSQLQVLKDEGKSYAEIARIFGCSREWIRRLSDDAGVTSRCRKCHAAVGARHKWCDVCRQEIRDGNAQKYAKRKLKSFGNRPVVLEAYRFFSDLGLDVVLNAEAKRREPELWVNGHSVKCNAMVPVSQGHQCRLGPNELAEYQYLSDEEAVYVIPQHAVLKKQTYIGEKDWLRKYRLDGWPEGCLRGMLASTTPG